MADHPTTPEPLRDVLARTLAELAKRAEQAERSQSTKPIASRHVDATIES